MFCLCIGFLNVSILFSRFSVFLWDCVRVKEGFRRIKEKIKKEDWENLLLKWKRNRKK